MPRSALLPGGAYVTETDTRAALTPGGGYLIETFSAGPATFKLTADDGAYTLAGGDATLTATTAAPRTPHAYYHRQMVLQP